MKDKPERIQGTDGIRREVISLKDDRVRGLSPLEVFLDKNFITEEFLELYAYAHVWRLLQTAAMQPGDEIVVGWDPRDTAGLFTEAVIRGIRKARGKAVVLGIVPTPAVPLYMLYRQAKGGIVITASHNPKDQNGIKIFLADQGLKLFPADDIRLTTAIYQASQENLSRLEESGGYENAHQDAVKVFLDFICDPYNSWIRNNTPSFEGLTLVVDPANGCYIGIAADAFRRSGVPEVVETNNQLNGEVNINSGVADLEGVSLITPSMVDGKFSRFARYEALQKVFEIGRRKRQDILSRKAQVSGAVFDADGDRFYYLEYNPLEDAVLVLSGDEVAFHQAKYLMETYPDAYRGSLFVNTIESDLNAASLASKSGFETRLTGVGDKWILLQAVLALLSAHLDLEMKQFPSSFQDELATLKVRLSALSKSSMIDGEAIVALARAIHQVGDGNERVEPLQKEILAKLLKPGVVKYAIGSEESGHQITLGRLRRKTGERIPVFSGNGLKSAINTLVAIRSLYLPGIYSLQTYMETLRHPFKPGLKKTFYTYYTDKSKLTQGTEVWRGLTEVIRMGCQVLYGRELDIQLKVLPEEPDTLYIAGYKDKVQTIGIFCRNSGTEDKTGVNVRGPLEDEEKLTQIGETALRYLIQTMKDSNHPYASAERVILNLLDQILVGSETELREELRKIDPNLKISLDRLLKEMSEKQKLIQVSPTGKTIASEPSYELTERGRWYVAHLSL